MQLKLIAFVFSVVLISFSVHAAKTYDFTAGNAKINAFAYEGISLDLPADKNFPPAQHSDSEYVSISANDDSVNTIVSYQKKTYPMSRYVFKLDEAEADINQLDFFWSGRGVNSKTNKNHGVVLYLWNYNYSRYDKIVTSVNTSSEINLTHAITENIFDYIDEHNWLTLLVISNDEVKNNESYSISTDYLSVTVRAEESVRKPILEYRFDECRYSGDAGDVVDGVGHFDGTSNGMLDSISFPRNDSIINKSLNLSANDTSDWVDVPSTAVNGLNDFSVSVWFKTPADLDDDDAEQQEIFHALGRDENDDELEIFLKDNKTVYIKVRDDSQELDSDIELTDGDWHHLALTRTDEDVCLFIDGIYQECDDGVGGGQLSVPYSNSVVIGQEQDSFGGGFSKRQNFEGQLDEFKIFNGKLSSTQITSIYNNEGAGWNYDSTPRDKVNCDDSCDIGTLNAVGIKIGWGTGNSQINTTTEALAIHAAWLAAGSPASGLINNRKYNVTASGSSTVDRIDFGGSPHDFSGTLPYPGQGAGVNGSDFLVHTSGTLSLPAGDYTIFVESDDGFSFVMNSLSGDTVSFNKFGNSTSGEPNELRHELPTGNSNTGGSFTLNQDSVFDIAAIFFERGGGDYLEISIANSILTSSAPTGYEILRHGEINGKVKFGQCSTPSKIDHFEIQHDGNGLTCEAKSITVNACLDTSCSSLSGESVTLDVKAKGSSRSVTDRITFTETGIASIPYTIAESVVLSLESASITVKNPTVCVGGSSSDPCLMTFADTGFQFTSSINSNGIPTQLSGKPSNKGYSSSTLSLQAIKTNPVNGACEAALVGLMPIELVAECIDPIECKGQQVTINSNNIDTQIGTQKDVEIPSSYSAVNLYFGNSTNNAANFNLTYPDAGKVQLHARYNIPVDGVPSDDYMQGSSNSFVVRPLGFNIDATDNPKAESAADAKFKKAGEEFTTNVTAVQWQADDDSDENGVPDDGSDLSNNNKTPNFDWEVSLGQVVLTHQLKAPSDGSLGSLSGNIITSFSDGTGETKLSWSEVGIISLTANLTSYMNTGSITGTIPYVGRFTPDHFKQTVAEHGELFTTCGAGSAFAYTGQTDALNPNIGAISYENQPIIEITAYNKQSAITRNYDGDFIKLSAGDVSVVAPTFDAVNNSSLAANIDTGILSQTDLTALSSGTALAKGVLHYQLSALDHFVYSRGSGTEVAPYTSAFELAVDTISDADSIDLLPSDGSARTATAAIPTGVEVRFGRLVLQNSFGPTAVNLTQPLQVEYFNGSNFVVSSDDNCLGYEDSRLSSSPDIDALGGTGIFIDGETRSIQLDGQDTDSSGEIRVSYDTYDWLKYDWDNGGDYNDNPSAIATFGLFRGNDRVIYRRVVN